MGLRPLRRAEDQLHAGGADVAGPIDERLRLRVRQTNDTTELWRLRAAILCSLEPGHPRTAQHQRDPQRDLDSLFGPTTLA